MPYDYHSSLWPVLTEHYFSKKEFSLIRQTGSHCVSTSLAMLTGQSPEFFQAIINTQDPVSWSDSIKPFGMKLAYCPTDVRKLKYYLEELVSLDDLFLLCYYSPTDPWDICADPNETGWICSSHVLILHRDQVLDPASGMKRDVYQHSLGEHFTKRIFRVLPSDHERGL